MFDSRRDLASHIDLAMLRAGASRSEVRDLCLRAREEGFAALVLLPHQIEAAAPVLEGSEVALAAAVAFPLGAATLPVKLFEALQCELQGAVELDVVLDHSHILSRDRRPMKKEVTSILEKTPDLLHKFIIELNLLEEGQLRSALKVINRHRPAFLKTGTGLQGPADPARVRLLRKDLDKRIRIKAAGGVRSPEQVEELFEAGADRVGTSAGFEILDAWDRR